MNFTNLTETQKKIVYSYLTFLTNAYVWQNVRPDNGSEMINKNITVLPRQTLPPNLTVPLFEISNMVGIVPIASYSTVVLSNWKLKDETQPMSLENIETVVKFTKFTDEDWFYKVHIMMEHLGTKGIESCFKLMKIGNGDDNNIIIQLHQLTTNIKEITKNINRMTEGCDPKIFYYKLRPFLSGWTDSLLFPKGFGYDVGNDNIKYSRYRGGSGAQSTLIQLFDLVLGVDHNHDQSKSFLKEMEQYMPKKHALILTECESNLRSFIMSSSNTELITVFNKCVSQLETLRTAHYELVKKYVRNMTEKPESELKGSGGSDLAILLNTVRDETKEARIGTPKMVSLKVSGSSWRDSSGEGLPPV